MTLQILNMTRLFCAGYETLQFNIKNVALQLTGVCSDGTMLVCVKLV